MQLKNGRRLHSLPYGRANYNHSLQVRHCSNIYFSVRYNGNCNPSLRCTEILIHSCNKLAWTLLWVSLYKYTLQTCQKSLKSGENWRWRGSFKSSKLKVGLKADEHEFLNTLRTAVLMAKTMRAMYQSTVDLQLETAEKSGLKPTKQNNLITKRTVPC